MTLVDLDARRAELQTQGLPFWDGFCLILVSPAEGRLLRQARTDDPLRELKRVPPIFFATIGYLGGRFECLIDMNVIASIHA